MKLRIAFAVLAALVLVAPALAIASRPLSDTNVKNATLKVNKAGYALVEYTTAAGLRRHVLVWGAINSNRPDPTVKQVRFKFDYAGGYGAFRKQVWTSFANACKPYDGPRLAYFVLGCKAADGTYWALQSWQRNLPLLGFQPWMPSQSAFEMHVSHWSGALATLEVYTHYTYGGSAEGLFGRLSYDGSPVYGFGATNVGNPTDAYGRIAYIDTYDSVYGSGWWRESAILVHRPTGVFCHSFVPEKPFPGYPSQDIRPAAPGEQYRVTVTGPGVTPDLHWIGPAPPMDAAYAAQMQATFDQVMAGDAKCAPERG